MIHLKTNLITYASAITLAVITPFLHSPAFGGNIRDEIIVPKVGERIPNLSREMQVGPEESWDNKPFLNRKYDLDGDRKQDVLAWYRKCDENNPNKLPFIIYYYATDTHILNNNPIDEIVDGVIGNYGEKTHTLNYDLLVSQYSVISVMPPCNSGLIAFLMPER